MFGAIIALLVGAAGAYYIHKNLDKIYSDIEFSKTPVAIALKFGILIDIMLVTGSIGYIFTDVPVAEIVMPLASFVAGFYFFLYKPTK